jgi:hypothetical protein
MNLNSAKFLPPQRKPHWQTLAIILVFLLLALIVWRWFDYQIARLTFPSNKGVSGVLTQKPLPPADAVKSLHNE